MMAGKVADLVAGHDGGKGGTLFVVTAGMKDLCLGHEDDLQVRASDATLLVYLLAV